MKWHSCILFFFLLLVRKAVSVAPDTPPAKKLERGKVVGRINANVLYSAYREVQDDYHAKAFSCKQPWKILNKKEGVEIAMLHLKEDPSCPYVRMTAIMPASVQNCWNFLKLENWNRVMPKIDPFYAGLTILGEYSKWGINIILARKWTKHIFAFGKRDFVFISVSDHPRSDGTWVSGSVSIKTPRVKGYTRAFQDSITFYKPVSDDKTEMTIVCRIDMNDSGQDGTGGFIPMFFYVKTLGTTAMRSVLNMRKALEEEEELRRLQEEAKRARFGLPWQQRSIEEESESEDIARPPEEIDAEIREEIEKHSMIEEHEKEEERPPWWLEKKDTRREEEEQPWWLEKKDVNEEETPWWLEKKKEEKKTPRRPEGAELIMPWMIKTDSDSDEDESSQRGPPWAPRKKKDSSNEFPFNLFFVRRLPPEEKGPPWRKHDVPDSDEKAGAAKGIKFNIPWVRPVERDDDEVERIGRLRPRVGLFRRWGKKSKKAPSPPPPPAIQPPPPPAE